jgi:hypothetical protein
MDPMSLCNFDTFEGLFRRKIVKRVTFSPNCQHVYPMSGSLSHSGIGKLLVKLIKSSHIEINVMSGVRRIMLNAASPLSLDNNPMHHRSDLPVIPGPISLIAKTLNVAATRYRPKLSTPRGC